MNISQYYDNWDNRYYEMDNETYDHVCVTIYDGLVAGSINDNELLLDAMQSLGVTFGVKLRK